MCCFSRPVKDVSHTSIFARHTRPGTQALVYSMQVSTTEEVAMVLPLPVKPGGGEGALKFVDLSAYASFFADVESLFPAPAPASRSRSVAAAATPQKLAVQEVGSFVASYAPDRASMARLDPRFRLPESAWKGLPRAYETWGFAVFQLRPGARHVHPMAMTFPTSAPDRLFFPTVHVHDGQFHESAEFDHVLYCQAPRAPVAGADAWARSPLRAQDYVDLGRTAGMMTQGACFKQRLYGHRPNTDSWAAFSA